MDSELQNRLMKVVDQMPPFPKSVHRVIELTNDLNCAPKDLVQVIEHDPVITMKMLKLVNSAFFSLAKSVTSVRHAVVYLGLNTVKNLALTVRKMQVSDLYYRFRHTAVALLILWVVRAISPAADFWSARNGVYDNAECDQELP